MKINLVFKIILINGLNKINYGKIDGSIRFRNLTQPRLFRELYLEDNIICYSK